jgi:hypothetical protein
MFHGKEMRKSKFQRLTAKVRNARGIGAVNSKPEVFYRQAVVNEFGEGIDADAEVAIHEFRVDDVVAGEI